MTEWRYPAFREKKRRLRRPLPEPGEISGRNTLRTRGRMKKSRLNQAKGELWRTSFSRSDERARRLKPAYQGQQSQAARRMAGHMIIAETEAKSMR